MLSKFNHSNYLIALSFTPGRKVCWWAACRRFEKQFIFEDFTVALVQQTPFAKTKGKTFVKLYQRNSLGQNNSCGFLVFKNQSSFRKFPKPVHANKVAKQFILTPFCFAKPFVRTGCVDKEIPGLHAGDTVGPLWVQTLVPVNIHVQFFSALAWTMLRSCSTANMSSQPDFISPVQKQNHEETSFAVHSNHRWCKLILFPWKEGSKLWVGCSMRASMAGASLWTWVLIEVEFGEHLHDRLWLFHYVNGAELTWFPPFPLIMMLALRWDEAGGVWKEQGSATTVASLSLEEVVMTFNVLAEVTTTCLIVGGHAKSTGALRISFLWRDESVEFLPNERASKETYFFETCPRLVSFICFYHWLKMHSFCHALT